MNDFYASPQRSRNGYGERAADKQSGLPDSCISRRRSCRRFSGRRIAPEHITTILTAATLAPSGKNGQPWRFAAVHENKELLGKLASLTVYSFAGKADCLIAVYLDKSRSYHYIKDVQAIGACIQNMLLQAEELGIATCWIGEILNRAEEVNALLDTDNNLELMAIIALGYADGGMPQPRKRGLDNAILFYD